MQISLKWISELVNIQFIDLNELIEKLTLGGFEVEEIIELEIENKSQLALDISATANRSDSLSIQGISTEMLTLLNQKPKVSRYSLERFSWKQNLKTVSTLISDQSNCSAFTGVIVENITDTRVPKWITQKLMASGITPMGNLVDFQNYILLETGYPLAFYDFDKICSKLETSTFTLSLSTKNENQTFLASNEVSYNLDSSSLVVTANNLPLSIGGIIEHQDISFSDSTTSLLIEGSIFEASMIRKQSRNLGLRTDRSARYEKSLKDTYLMQAFYRLLSLLKISNPTLTCKLHTNAQKPQVFSHPIQLRYQTVSEILGPVQEETREDWKAIPPELITTYLERLNFEVSYDNTNFIWEVKIPDSRSDDITREIDLIEEIGRLHGFNNFLTALPQIKNIGTEDPSYQTRKKITSCLINLGLNELIHYSLVPETTFLKNEIHLINPLLSDCSSLRVSLLPSLMKTVQENLKQGNQFIEGFEYGHVFSGDILDNLQEKEYLAGIFGGIKTKLDWSSSEVRITWFEAKGKIEQLFKQLNILTYWESSSSKESKILHPYRSAEVYLTDGIKLGVFGQIHPIVANQLGIPSEVYLFEFDIELIKHQIQANKLTIYKEYSSYPKIIKDLSFIIKEDVSFAELQTSLYSNGTQFLSEVNLLDEYTGQSIPVKHKSLCLQLTFQSKEKTLENKKIETILNNLQIILTNKFDALMRN